MDRTDGAPGLPDAEAARLQMEPAHPDADATRPEASHPDAEAARPGEDARSDEALYRAYLKGGDNEALRCLLERYRESLTLFLFGYVRSAEDAEELMLDAFAELAAGPTVFSERSSFKTWLFSVGKHLALKQLRRQRREVPLEELPDADRGPQPETALLREERDRQLYAALERIAPEYREVLLLQYMEDMAPADIARVTGRRVKQVYNLIDRGKLALRSELEKTGFIYEMI